MSTQTTEPLPLKAQPEKPKARYRWIDQMRGATLLYVVMSTVINWTREIPLVAFFFSHPPREVTYMNFRDVNTSAFIFIMGFLYGFAFRRHEAKTGTKRAVTQLFSRYLMILAVGFLISFIGFGAFLRERPLVDGGSITVVVWDVLQTIGTVGLVGFLFLFLKPKFRLVAGYSLILFYQAMLSIEQTSWALYALKSTHGGMLGAMFGFSGVLIIGSALGEYFFANVGKLKSAIYKRLILFGLLNLALGFGLFLLFDMPASKRLVSLPYCLICMGTTMLVSMIFVLLEKRDKQSFLLDSFGKNSLLVYMLAIFLELIFFQLLLEGAQMWLQTIVGVLSFIAVILIATQVHKRFNVVRTEKVAFVALIIMVILVGVLLPTGIIEMG